MYNGATFLTDLKMKIKGLPSMQQEKLQHLITIPATEKDLFKKLIQTRRKELIPPPKLTVEKIIVEQKTVINTLLKAGNISKAITVLREAAYDDFLNDEASFNIEILKNLTKSLSTPKKILNNILNTVDLAYKSRDELLNSIASICGEYAGEISPYIYELSLSNTQSRRSRAGKTFEQIIYHLYQLFDFPFNSQFTIGKTQFKDKGLGKIVDSLLPSIEAFEQRRDKVIIGTMKTTLRERWQEVIEEISRTGLPNIHLLTVDEDISTSKAEQMSRHNVVLVVLDTVKRQEKLTKMANIVSFEEYFNQEIPDMLRFWNLKNV
jgi:RNase H-fold protein (predicted Holliday junction resolvase)